ncbi:MAG: metal ABC transporter ATP-binding protein [Candidatus Cloacimonetes bacterium]|nr:metal ABC transporter ATP-binding protein [Candidatus Cloacimonadota bacterium]
MIEIRNLNYQVNNKIILKDINLFLKKGEFIAILGPNGAGKSTLVKIIIALINDYRGTVLIEGSPNRQWMKKNRIGYLPQGEKLDADFPATALDIVLMGYAGTKGLFRSFSSSDKERAYHYLEIVGLVGKELQYIGSLSGGEFQRVLLARALMSESEIFFLDEPEASLDTESVKGFFQLLNDINQQGKTIIVVSHDLNILTQHTSFLICLNKTLHFHDKTELLSAETIKKTYGEAVKLVDKIY